MMSYGPFLGLPYCSPIATYSSFITPEEMKYPEITTLSPEEQKEKLTEATESLRQLRFAHAISPIENPMRIRQSKKFIAQLKTAQKAQAITNN